VHVLDLSTLGARIGHQMLLRDGVVCYLELSAALGALRLTGRIVWTWLRDTEQTLEGHQRSHYESGIEFTSLTSAQQDVLATALETLRAVGTDPAREPSA
jgi:hypothetical protein